jgi:1-acyl-sn-glycerol-3-phosphate acyltransferase
MSSRKAPLAKAGHLIGIPLLSTFWKIRSLGSHNVPQTGPVILAGNHVSMVDGPMMFAYAPRPVHMLIKEEMFSGPLNPILRNMGHLPVARGAADRGFLGDCLEILGGGGALGVFPEGTRGEGDFGTVHNGLAYFALRSGAPIVPVACLGTGTGGGKAVPTFRAKIDVVYGKPFHAADPGGPRTRKALAAASTTIVERLSEHLEHAAKLTGRTNQTKQTNQAH